MDERVSGMEELPSGTDCVATVKNRIQLLPVLVPVLPYGFRVENTERNPEKTTGTPMTKG